MNNEYINEIWKDIKGYEGLYQVSNFGRVKSLERESWNGKAYFIKKEQIRTILKDTGGYYYIGLTKEGKTKNYMVHRLVAEAFIPNPDNYPEVNHKDENKLNNCVDNLEWCTSKYNANYGNRNNKVKEIIRKKGINKPVLQYDLDGNFIKEYDALYQAYKATGIRHTNISTCCRGIYKQSGGFIWKFKE